MYTEVQVKEDLKRISKKNHDIAVMVKTKAKYECRLKLLDNTPNAEYYATKRLIESITNRLEQTIMHATELESVYMGAIVKLPPLYRTAVLDHYINGNARRKVASNANYSDSNMAKIIKTAISKLTEEMNA